MVTSGASFRGVRVGIVVSIVIFVRSSSFISRYERAGVLVSG